MVLEDFTYYSIFDSRKNYPIDEAVYQRMLQLSSKEDILRRTNSDELFYSVVYSPRLPHCTLKTHHDYVAYNDVISHHKMLNDKKEMKENNCLFFIRELFCCR